MILEINVSLLGAVAIIASLLNMNLGGTKSQVKVRNTLMRVAIWGFAISGLASTLTLMSTVLLSLQGLPGEGLVPDLLTVVSLGSFLISTEVLAGISLAKFGRS